MGMKFALMRNKFNLYEANFLLTMRINNVPIQRRIYNECK